MRTNSNFNARILVLFIVLAGGIALSLNMARPPAVVRANAPETEFSAERAMVHVSPIAQKAHPTGSAEIFEVRDYILSELGQMGLEPEVQVTVSQSPLREKNVAAIENILVKLPGTDSSRAIVVMGHYDSVPNSPGAADDAAAVAVMFETARALTAGPPLLNDVIFLFTDAEEETVGGGAAAREHPWLSEVGLVLNLEMRGSSGPVYMFETGPENGWIIPEFAEAVPYPATSSLMGTIYSTMPNNTDFTAFRKAGYSGFNISVLEQVANYHTALDTIDALDSRSLQHHGLYTLGIVRHFGNLDLTNVKGPNAIYFDMLGSTLIHYPGFLAVPLAVLAILIFAVVVAIGWRRRHLTFKGIGLGFLAFLAALIGGPGVMTLLWFLIRTVAKPPVLNGDTFNSPLYILGFGLLVVAITAALYSLFRRRVSTADLAMGALLWWAILLIVATAMFPVANFVFLWPLLFAPIAVMDLILTKNQQPLTWMGVAVLSVAALPGILLMPPMIHSVVVGLLQVLSLNGAGLILLSLLLGLLIPHLKALTWSEFGPGQWWLAGGSAIAGTIVIIVAMVSLRIDADHPRVVHLIYGLDTDAGRAVWASLNSSETFGFDLSQEWTGQFLTEAATDGPLPILFGSDPTQFTADKAPVADLLPTQVQVLENTRDGNTRRLRLSIKSPQGATQAGIYIEPPAEVVGVMVNGKRVAVADNPPDRDEMWELQFWGPLGSGLDLELEIKTTEPIRMRVVERSDGLPEIGGVSTTGMPDHLIPYGDTDFPSHVTYVSSFLIFD